MTKKLTINDIAKLAGVGKSTVSRVITNHPKVKASTREKVERVIQECGFVPSKSAQVLGGGSAKVIGIILSRLDSSSENKVVSGILEVIYAAGYDALIMEGQFNAKKTNEHLAVLQKRNVDGVILFGFTGCDLSAIEQLAYKAVVIAVDSERISSVGYDNYGIIEQAMTHIQEQGKQHISYIGVDPKDKTTGLMRLNAYLDYCKHANLKPNFQTGLLSHKSAYDLTDRVLTTETEAIVCASDTLALGVAKRLQVLNRSDVLVSGVGATDLLAFIFPNTFSIDPGYFLAGRTSAQLLIKQLQGMHEVTHLTQTSSIPVTNQNAFISR
jgi:LacI family trehalose operon transcriptional repressor